MNWQVELYVIASIGAAVISVSVACIAWRRRATPGAASLALLMLAVAEWAFAAAMEAAASGAPVKILWSKIEYLGAASGPALVLMVALEYSRQGRQLPRPALASLWIIPVVTMAMAATNEWHNLLWNSFTPVHGSNVLIYGHGPWFWFAVAYFYLLILAGMLTLGWALVRFPPAYRGQIAILLAGSVMPWTGNALYILGLSPIPGLDMAPVGFVLTGLILAWGLFRVRLFDLAPVAREALVESMNDGVVVLDMQGRVVDINRAAQRITGLRASQLIGQPAEQVFGAWSNWVECYRDTLEAQAEVTVGEGQAQRHYDLRISPLTDRREHLAGRLLVFRDITGRKQVEAALQNSEERYRALFDGMPVGLYRSTPDGRIIDANPALAHMLGCPNREALLATNVAEFYKDAGQRERWQAMVEREGVAYHSEGKMRRCDGSIIWVRGSARVIRDAQGQVLYYEGSLEDITERKRIETERRQAEANLSALYAITRMTGRSLAVEDVLSQALTSILMLLGFEAGAISLADPDNGLLRVAVQRGLPPAHLERFQQKGLELAACVYEQHETLAISDLAQESSAIAREAVAEMAGLGWRAYVGIPLAYQSRPLGVISLFARQPRLSSAYDLVFLTTIGDQIATAIENARLFQATLSQRSRLEALIRSSRDGVILVDLEGRVLVINMPTLHMLRLPGQPEEWIGRSMADVLRVLHVYAPAVVQVVLSETRRVRREPTLSGEGECEIAPYAIHWLSLPVLAGARLLGRLVILRDVTGERAVERLRQDMTHTMVHDLRNPLSNIVASLDVLMSGALGEISFQQHEVIDAAQHSAQRLVDLVNAILDVSRLESGQMPLKRTMFVLADLAGEVFRSQAALAGEKGLGLESDVPPALPPAWADAGLIERVLQNLVGNAIKFTPPGGLVRVTARLVEREGQPPVLHVAVSDTGPGVPSDIQGRLFQKFVAGSQPGRGSGLGLAFCKLAVEAHGGRIWVESAAGQGATFTFTLATAPLAEDV